MGLSVVVVQDDTTKKHKFHTVRPKTVRTAELMQQALELRKQGWSYTQIGRQLGITPNRAASLVHKALSKWVSEVAEDVRLLELQRLDALLSAYWEPALKGDGAAADRVLRIMEQRAKLLGLNQVQVVENDLGRLVFRLLTKLTEEPTAVIEGEYRSLPQGTESSEDSDQADDDEQDER